MAAPSEPTSARASAILRRTSTTRLYLTSHGGHFLGRRHFTKRSTPYVCIVRHTTHRQVMDTAPESNQGQVVSETLNDAVKVEPDDKVAGDKSQTVADTGEVNGHSPMQT
mmetsp:Transcript_26673/g.63443  ORF Transcript_26673/g.63443 Transcript_26673/m.63443 type:complete len:110 (+) Transcript_26673:771-1100(+)